MPKFLILLILLMFGVPAYNAPIYGWAESSFIVPQKDVQTESSDQAYWNRKLTEAASNYEKALQKILNEGERLVWHRYGSKTQYQMFTAELPSISERLETYKRQMTEAKTMLDKFTKEDQEREKAYREGDTPSVTTDLYGRDEAWWKDRVRSWKEQLKEARQDYEEACDAFVKQAETLGPSRFGRLSLTQYQMISSRLTELTGRMAKDQTQISESRTMLSKLSEEAREAKADPAWLE